MMYLSRVQTSLQTSLNDYARCHDNMSNSLLACSVQLFISAIECSLSHASSKVNYTLKHLVGWAKGHLCSLKILIKYEIALRIWGHSCSSEKELFFLCFPKAPRISPPTHTDCNPKDQHCKFFGGHFSQIWNSGDQFHLITLCLSFVKLLRNRIHVTKSLVSSFGTHFPSFSIMRM